MCGIAGIHRRGAAPLPKAGRLANELLREIEKRGPHATGWLAMLDSGRVQTEKVAETASRYLARGRRSFRSDFRTLILHTRYATIGAKNARNAHPVINGRCAAVHNGTIWNHREVFGKIGAARNASVDSEVIPAVVSWGGWDDAATALSFLDGGAATAIVTNERPGELLLARLRDYPLVYLVRKDVIVWASTREAIWKAWRATYGTAPRGRWVEVGEFELHRINGRISVEAIERRYGAARPTPRTFSTPTAPRPKATSGTTAKRRRKRSRKTKTTEPSLFDYYGEGAVRDLMRWTGVDRTVAEEMVYG